MNRGEYGRREHTFSRVLEGIYGRSAVDHMAQASGMERKDIETVGDVFMPAFLESLMKARRRPHKTAVNKANATPSFANFWLMKWSMQCRIFQTKAPKRQRILPLNHRQTTAPSPPSMCWRIKPHRWKSSIKRHWSSCTGAIDP